MSFTIRVEVDTPDQLTAAVDAERDRLLAAYLDAGRPYDGDDTARQRIRGQAAAATEGDRPYREIVEATPRLLAAAALLVGVGRSVVTLRARGDVLTVTVTGR